MDRTNASQPKLPQHCQQTHSTPAETTQTGLRASSVLSNIVLSEHKHASQKPETQTSAETGTHSAENDNVILVTRTPTIGKILLRPLSRQCPQESIGAAAVPDGVPAGKLEPKTVTETGASELASWRQTQTSAASVTSKHQTADAGRPGATQIFRGAIQVRCGLLRPVSAVVGPVGARRLA